MAVVGAGRARPWWVGGTLVVGRIRPTPGRSRRAQSVDQLVDEGVGVKGVRVQGAGSKGWPRHIDVGPHRLGQPCLFAYGVEERIRLGQHLGAVGLPRRAECLEHAAEGRHAVALLGREVGAGVEGPPVGRAEHRHRPPAGAGEGLGG